MLPDFPQIKKEIHEIFIALIQSRAKQQDPMLKQLKVTHQHEGQQFQVNTADGFKENNTYKKISAQFSLKDEQIKNFTFSDLTNLAEQIAKQLSEQQAGIVFKKLNKITKKTGNTVDAKGEQISPDLLFKCLEKIQIDFDENGNPEMPQLVVSPQAYEKLKDKLPEWDKDEGYKKKHQELIEKKREEWRDRESNRKLVD